MNLTPKLAPFFTLVGILTSINSTLSTESKIHFVLPGESSDQTEQIVLYSKYDEEPYADLIIERKLNNNDWLVFDTHYEGVRTGIIRIEFESIDGHSGFAGFSFIPDVPARVAFPIQYLDSQRLKLPRTAGTLRNGYRDDRINPAQIKRIRIMMKHVLDEQKLTITKARILDHEPGYPVPNIRLVDELGQNIRKNWPGKTPDKASMISELQKDLQESAIIEYPENWSKWGGNKNLKLSDQGFFRVQKTHGRWHLIDPDGYSFFSMGLDKVSPKSYGPVVPGTKPFYTPLEEGASYTDFSVLNLKRAFGSNWYDSWVQLTEKRLKKWGMNTIGNFSDLEFIKKSQIPYVVQWPKFPSTETKVFRDFPDVFSQEYEQQSIECASFLNQFKGDRSLIGYFMRNEPKWGFGNNNIALKMLANPKHTVSRSALLEWLKSKYTESEWNAKWENSPEENFSSILDDTWIEEQFSETAKSDLWEFSKIMARRYVEVPLNAAKKIDQEHLNLGIRYAYISSGLCLEAGSLFDVFSINAYGFEPPADQIELIAESTGKPVIIGEFHFGALDRGLPSTGLRGVKTQRDRGLAYRRYVEHAAANKNVVGVHYFILLDQPYLGRYDGENYQIGFVNVCHNPYDDFTEEVSDTQLHIYEVMQGNKKPFDGIIEEIPNNLFQTTIIGTEQ